MHQPIYFNEHRFNVEEKRSQIRGGGPFNRGMMTGGMGPRPLNPLMDSKQRLDQRTRGDRRDMYRERPPFADRQSGEAGVGGRKPPVTHVAGSSAAAPPVGPPRNAFAANRR